MPTAYITAPEDAAARLAEELVERRLAACVNIFECDSVYRWENEVHTDEEMILLAKTTDGCYDSLVEWVESEHPYEVPCIERFDEAGVLPAFKQWRDESVRLDT